MTTANQWAPVVDLVEKLTALAIEWDKTPGRQDSATELRAVLAGHHDPRPDYRHEWTPQ